MIAGHSATLALPAASAALSTPTFTAALLDELRPLLASHPLLAAATEQGGRIEPASVRLTLLGGDAAQRDLRLGVFCDEIVGGCSCGDPPYTTPLYLELTLRLDPRAATAKVRLLLR
ncbi:MAG: hypothetical protein LJE69_04050 [Thiohalocapsa sp.]|jgi:hypothetical protein|uniref:hypothetical protein n=1 Tax=Thiohalocapsa sp. TaxID=2497641 RepID=UPI0025FED7ED|nr:hypothetical protein [Thiohalocapsa sp.]MCG6940406.1 hypothetical protein [Thiohalocapsa sp.]